MVCCPQLHFLYFHFQNEMFVIFPKDAHIQLTNKQENQEMEALYTVLSKTTISIVTADSCNRVIH